MHKDLQSLITLQESDSKLSRAVAEKKILPERMAKLETAYLESKKEFDQFQNSFNDLKNQYRDKERQLKQGHDDLRKAKDRLESVKNNKEYQAILKEIEGIQQKKEDVELEGIMLLDVIDKKSEELKEQEKSFQGVEGKYEHDRAFIMDELQKLDQRMETCQQENDSLRAAAAEALVKKYDAIRKLCRDVVVVPVRKEVCQGCHMNIPPQMYNELQTSAALMSCPHCNRIIYREEPPENAGSG
ncbi:MAG: C4-type zinc ribbon domain-containing protein [Syntrophobacterales bacterium]|nr:C4-type zinc ribbon domain-containing protein [Syntrophobacterales bacterium]